MSWRPWWTGPSDWGPSEKKEGSPERWGSGEGTDTIIVTHVLTWHWINIIGKTYRIQKIGFKSMSCCAYFILQKSFLLISLSHSHYQYFETIVKNEIIYENMRFILCELFIFEIPQILLIFFTCLFNLRQITSTEYKWDDILYKQK